MSELLEPEVVPLPVVEDVEPIEPELPEPVVPIVDEPVEGVVAEPVAPIVDEPVEGVVAVPLAPIVLLPVELLVLPVLPVLVPVVLLVVLGEPVAVDEEPWPLVGLLVEPVGAVVLCAMAAPPNASAATAAIAVSVFLVMSSFSLNRLKKAGDLASCFRDYSRPALKK